MAGTERSSVVVDRRARMRSLLRRCECTHLIITDPVDAFQICGFSASHLFLLISSRRSLIFTDFRYHQAATTFVRANPSWKYIGLEGNAFASVASYIPSGSRIGYQSNLLAVDALFALRRVCSGCTLVRLREAVSWELIPKTPAEVRAMTKAAAIGSRALEQTMQGLAPGVSEQEVAFKLEEACRNHGSQHPSFDSIVLFGPRSALPHGTPGRTRLKRGDFVLIDFGCTVEGVCSDMTRTFVAGSASPRQKAMYEAVRRAQRIGTRMVRPLMRGCDVDSEVRASFERDGFADAFGHATGHGIGYRVHEHPRLSAREKRPIPPGAVVTIEPGVYLPETGGVRIEDMVYLPPCRTPRILTTFPRHLMELPL